MLPIRDILVRSASGFILATPILILYFMGLKIFGKKQKPLHIVAAFLFCYYIFGMLTVTGIGYTRLRHFLPKFVFAPFVGMIGGPIEALLNIVLFVPLGFFLPLLYSRYRHIAKVTLTGFLLSVSVELVQMFDWGATDINDLITNTAGACVGYLVYHLLAKAVHKDIGVRLSADRISDVVELLFFVAAAFVIMITVQPWFVHDVIRLS